MQHRTQSRAIRRRLPVVMVAMFGLVAAPSSALAANGDGEHSGKITFNSEVTGEGVCIKTTNFTYDSTKLTSQEQASGQSLPDVAALEQGGQTFQGPVTVTFELEGPFYQNMAGTFQDPACTIPADVDVTSWTITGTNDQFGEPNEVRCEWSEGSFRRVEFKAVGKLPADEDDGYCQFDGGKKVPTSLIDVSQSNGCNGFPPTECDATRSFTVEDSVEATVENTT
jgi:hypothetical protein